ncbi:MAG: ABC transporter substrate-binding protein, partial [Roseibium sp.]
MRKTLLLAGVAVCAFAGSAMADCPPVTMADMKGVKAGAFPQQYELAEFEATAGCKLAFAGNPKSADLNGKIQGNGALPSLAER